MIKTILLSTALIAWPFVTMAQDAPTPSTPPSIESMVTGPCPHPVTSELNDKLVKDFDLTSASFVAVAKGIILETDFFTARTPDKDGDNMVVSLGTFMKDSKVINQCVMTITFTNSNVLGAATKRWEDYKKAGGHLTEIDTPDTATPPPTPVAPGTPVPAPTLKDDPDKDD